VSGSVQAHLQHHKIYPKATRIRSLLSPSSFNLLEIWVRLITTTIRCLLAATSTLRKAVGTTHAASFTARHLKLMAIIQESPPQLALRHPHRSSRLPLALASSSTTSEIAGLQNSASSDTLSLQPRSRTGVLGHFPHPSVIPLWRPLLKKRLCRPQLHCVVSPRTVAHSSRSPNRPRWCHLSSYSSLQNLQREIG
jgi:hypothetical protein